MQQLIVEFMAAFVPTFDLASWRSVGENVHGTFASALQYCNYIRSKAEGMPVVQMFGPLATNKPGVFLRASFDSESRAGARRAGSGLAPRQARSMRC